MNILKLTGGVAAMIATLGLAVPAEAQRHGGGGDREHHGRRHQRSGDKIDAGGLILGAVLLGGILALGDSEKKRRERAEVYEADYDASAPETGSPVPEMPAPNSAEYDGLYDVEAAGDRCASEAETLAQSYARLTRVTSVSSTTWSFGKWIVKGKVELADAANEAPRTHKFRCLLRAGSAPQVTFEGL